MWAYVITKIWFPYKIGHGNRKWVQTQPIYHLCVLPQCPFFGRQMLTFINNSVEHILFKFQLSIECIYLFFYALHLLPTLPKLLSIKNKMRYSKNCVFLWIMIQNLHLVLFYSLSLPLILIHQPISTYKETCLHFTDCVKARSKDG